jgi:hypothetical protein
MGFALIMVHLVAEIDMSLDLVLLFLRELSHGHSFEPCTVATYVLALWWLDVNTNKESSFIWHKWGLGVW